MSDFSMTVEEEAALQEVLFGIRLENYGVCLEYAKKVGIGVFVRNLLLAVKYRWMNVEIYANLVKDTIEGNEETVDEVCKHLTIPFCENEMYISEAYRAFFTYSLLSRGIIDIGHVSKWLQCGMDEFSGTEKFRSLFFVWLAPELEAHCIELYNKMWEEFKHCWTFDYICMVVHEVCVDLPRYQADDWKLLKQCRDKNHKFYDLMNLLASDNVQEFCDMLSSTELNIDSAIPPYTFEWRPCFNSCPTIIQCAALFGALKCFKHLLLEGAQLSKEDFVGHSVCDAAVAGGNLEILRLLEQNDLPFDGAIKTATEYHRNEVVEWLLTTGKCSLVDEKGACPLLNISVMSNNYPVFDMCMAESVDLMKSSHDDVLLIITVQLLFILLHAIIVTKC